MKADRDTFGPRLRRERERRGIALKSIAASTKIKESLFVELERNDFSNWPEGIFRRAHLCAYASAVGLPPQPILAEYLRLFCEAPPAEERKDLTVGETGAAQQTAQPKAEEPSEWGRPGAHVVDRAWVVSFDAAAVCLISSIVAGVAGWNLWPAITLVGLAYSAVGSACFAQSPGTHFQERIRAVLDARRPPEATAKKPRFESQPVIVKPSVPSVPEVTMDREDEVEDRRASA